MMKEYQVTLLCNTNKYKPVACIITREQECKLDMSCDVKIRKELINKGIQKICTKRYWTKADIAKYGYTRAKVRLYDKEKIARENEERYNRIKEEKYASGEWVRPKSQQE